MEIAEGVRIAEADSVRSANVALRRVSPRAWQSLIAILDLNLAVAATAIAFTFRFGQTDASVRGFHYIALVLIIPPIWVGLLAMTGSYNRRLIGSGPEEYQQVGNAGLWLLVIFAVSALLFQAEISRNFASVTVIMTATLALAGRFLARKRLHQMLARGWALHQVVLVGSLVGVLGLAKHMGQASYAGYRVVALSPTDTPPVQADAGFRVIEYGQDLPEEAVKQGADTIAVVNADALPAGELRRLSWRLEGTGVRLIVAPSLTDIAGPRIVVRPVAGLPLLHIDEPELTGVRLAAKAVLDQLIALVLLVICSPILVATAAAIWIVDQRNPFFKQIRVGRDGHPFEMWKFRSMRPTAEIEREGLSDRNDHDGLLFKMRVDPRTTGIGRWLRRHSIDELPQLWNVVRGEMSLVGPRPALPHEVERYGEDIRRRLKVKPGMTGLWQISGRADVPWEEAVRLDLYYVENWSVTLDLMVLWKTLPAVILGRGAY